MLLVYDLIVIRTYHETLYVSLNISCNNRNSLQHINHLVTEEEQAKQQQQKTEVDLQLGTQLETSIMFN